MDQPQVHTDPGGGGKSTVNVERINNPCRSALAPHRWAPDPCRSWEGELTVDIERINNLCRSAPGLCRSAPGLCRSAPDLCGSWGGAGGRSKVNMERINSEILHGQFKRFNLCVLHVGFKPVLQYFISTKSCTLTWHLLFTVHISMISQQKCTHWPHEAVRHWPNDYHNVSWYTHNAHLTADLPWVCADWPQVCTDQPQIHADPGGAKWQSM